MSNVYAQRNTYPTLVTLYELHILELFEYEPVAGVVQVPTGYAAWLDELEQTASTLSQEPVSVLRHDSPGLISYTGLGDVAATDLVCNLEELQPVLSQRGGPVRRLLLYVRDMLSSFEQGLYKNPEFARESL